MITKLLAIANHKLFPYGLLVLVVVGVWILWPRRARPSDEYRHDQAQLKTIERLIEVTINQNKALTVAKDQTIAILAASNERLIDERKTADAYYNTIKTKGNEKINRVDSYTVPDILRYMSDKFGATDGRFGSDSAR